MTDLTPRPPSQDFYLERMEVIHERTQGKTDNPHRHDYYTVLFVVRAAGRHIVDFQTYPLGELEVHFISPGQVHQVQTTQPPEGWVITFSREFLLKNNIPESFISNLKLFRSFGETPPLPIDERTRNRLKGIITEMEACLLPNTVYRDRALGALLQLFLIYCSNCCLLDGNQLDEENSGVCILRDFKGLVDEHFQEWHKVGEYADQLFISSKHLSATTKELTGKAAKTIIQDRILLEAKRYLLHTDMTAKQIAFKLGFSEPLHFSAFFKKQTGLSVSAFRKGGKPGITP